jgi:hypothetical protein
MQKIILTFHQFKQFFFKGISFHCKLNQYNVTRHKLVTKAVVIPTIMFAVFHLSWLEDDVCSETKKENAIEHCSCHNVAQNRTHNEIKRKQLHQTQNEYYTKVYYLAAPALRTRMCVTNASTDCQGTAMYIFPEHR